MGVFLAAAPARLRAQPAVPVCGASSGGDCRNWSADEAAGRSVDPVRLAERIFRQMADSSDIHPEPAFVFLSSAPMVSQSGPDCGSDGRPRLKAGDNAIFASLCSDNTGWRPYVAAGLRLLDMAGPCRISSTTISSEDVLAYLFAHELAHLALEHPMRMVTERSRLCPTGTCSADQQGALNRISAGFERQADIEALILMRNTGHDERAGQCAQLRIADLEPSFLGAPLYLFPEAIRTHPPGAIRAEDVGAASRH
jgi:hypothetical protein